MPQIGSVNLYNKLSKTYEVEIINFDYLYYKGDIKFSNNMDDNIKMFAEYIMGYNPKLLLFYTICISYPITLKLAEIIKQQDKEIIIIFGGPQATLTAIETISKYDFVDVIGIGEAENYIGDLVKAILSKQDLDAIEGIVFSKNGNIKYNKPSILPQMDELESNTCFDYTKYLKCIENTGKNVKVMPFPIESGRGCPFSCTFCSSSVFFERKYRVKNYLDIIDEMIIFNRLYNISYFSLNHDSFTVDYEYLMKFCSELINRDLNLEWSCSSRIDVLDKKILLRMKEAKCKSIYIGFESGSNLLQKKINKNLNVQKAVNLIKYAKSIGFNITVSFIYGFPEETMLDFYETIKVIETLMIMDIDNIQLHKFFPLPQTIELKKITEFSFSPDDIDYSIYSKCIFNDNLNKIILEDEYIFSCFYTFDSEIRSTYKRMDILISCFTIFKKIYKHTIKYLIKNVGLIRIFETINKSLDDVYFILNNRTLNDYANCKNEVETLYDLFTKITDHFINTNNSAEVNQIFSFENLLYKYSTNQIQEDTIHIFKDNILDVIKGSSECLSEKNGIIKFSKINGETIATKMKIFN